MISNWKKYSLDDLVHQENTAASSDVVEQNAKRRKMLSISPTKLHSFFLSDQIHLCFDVFCFKYSIYHLGRSGKPWLSLTEYWGTYCAWWIWVCSMGYILIPTFCVYSPKSRSRSRWDFHFHSNVLTIYVRLYWILELVVFCSLVHRGYIRKVSVKLVPK